VRLFPEPVTNQKMVSMNAVYVDGFRRKKQFIVAEVPDAKSVALFWCMIKQNQIEQVIVLNEPGPDEAPFLPEQSEKIIYNGITVTYLREYYMKNSKIISCGLENVREIFLNFFLFETINGFRVETEKWSTSSS
jgi:Protein-tyrosine phosphatase